MAITSFVDKVVFEPVCEGGLHWCVAFELLLVYLRKVEGDSSYHINTIVRSLGGLDACREEAKNQALLHYPSEFFRPLGGNPGKVLDRLDGDSDGGKFYSGKITGFTKDSKAPWFGEAALLAVDADEQPKRGAGAFTLQRTQLFSVHVSLARKFFDCLPQFLDMNKVALKSYSKMNQVNHNSAKIAAPAKKVE